MLRETETKLKASLVEALKQWWEQLDSPDLEGVGYTGDNFIDIMATAALCVLLGITDAQDLLENEGLLKED